MVTTPKEGALVKESVVAPCATVFQTRLGWSGIAWSENNVVRRVTFAQPTFQDAGSEVAAYGDVRQDVGCAQCRLVERIVAYSEGESDDFLDILLDFEDLTDFQRGVLSVCRQIPRGQTRSYGDLAMLAGHPRAARAVGSVMAKNRFPIIVPCHRVVAASAGIGGFSAPGGTTTKKKLLAMEADAARAGDRKPR